jgi:hypothetical protein
VEVVLSIYCLVGVIDKIFSTDGAVVGTSVALPPLDTSSVTASVAFTYEGISVGCHEDEIVLFVG